MSRTFVQPGDTIDAVAPSGGVTVGVPVMFGALFGIPEVSAAEGETYSLTVVGVHRLPKAAVAMAAGAIAFFNTSTKAIGATGAGLFPIGAVIADAGSGDASVLVRLNGVAATAVAGT
jgi:predicted RecA/RadA family phage recombinase